jgi:hypothetical protein
MQNNAPSATNSHFGGPRCVPLLVLAGARRIGVVSEDRRAAAVVAGSQPARSGVRDMNKLVFGMPENCV